MLEKVSFFIHIFNEFFYWNGKYAYEIQNFLDKVRLSTILENIYIQRAESFSIKNSKKIYINLYRKKLKINTSVKEFE